jgi:plasmid stability protein
MRTRRDLTGLSVGLVFIAVIEYIAAMANLNIRNIDPALHARLRIRAAEHGRSMEAEVRQILTDLLQPAANDRAAHMARVRQRAIGRTRRHPQSDSTILIREDRDR